MARLPNALQAWGTEAFARALKDEMEGAGAGALPLIEGTSQGGFVEDSEVTVILYRSSSDGRFILADVGVFFTEIVAGCSCGDEPETLDAHCRLRVRIDRDTAEAKISVLSDEQV